MPRQPGYFQEDVPMKTPFAAKLAACSANCSREKVTCQDRVTGQDFVAVQTAPRSLFHDPFPLGLILILRNRASIPSVLKVNQLLTASGLHHGSRSPFSVANRPRTA
jgi:hypothetical protein